jgi:hypothetical protein
MEEYINWINQQDNDRNKKRRYDDDDDDDEDKCDNNNEGETSRRRLSFNDFDINEYWAYADYKYMINLVKSNENSLQEDVSV